MTEPDDLREELAAAIVRLDQRIDDLENTIRGIGEQAQNAEYMASDAKRAADDAARTTQRGW